MTDIKTSDSAQRAQMKPWKVIPFFASSDIESTIQFYTTKLSFTVAGIHPDPPQRPQFVSIISGDKAAVNIYFLRELRGKPPPPGRAMVALPGPAAVDNLWKHLSEKEQMRVLRPEESGSEVRDAITNLENAWGYRQFEIWDLDANSLVFFAFLDEE